MSMSLLLILAAYFAIVLSLSLLNRRGFSGGMGRVMHFFRAFFPSWRFFDRFDDAPAIYYRVAHQTDVPFSSEWKPCLKRLPRKFQTIFHNPEGNYALAAGSLVQQLLSDIESIDEQRAHEAEGLVSFQLAKNLVRHQIREQDKTAPDSRYQFKIIGSDSGDLLISPVYSLKEP
jgi:hypothetical protein